MAEPPDNLDDTIGRLTQRERECLRLVAQLMTSKQIALQLGISKHTVDERIESARRRLGARGRYEAARLLAAHEGAGLFPPTESGPHTIGLVQSAGAATLPGVVGERGDVTAATAGPGLAADEQGADGRRSDRSDPPGQPAGRSALWPIDRSQLGLGARLGVVLLMAILSAMAFGGILSGLAALKRLH